jgi:hypothetical protein
MTPRRWIEYLAAILAGNAIYFLVLFPSLPPALQHRPFVFDVGLALDFFLCVTVYGVIRMGSRHAQRWNRRDFQLRDRQLKNESDLNEPRPEPGK